METHSLEDRVMQSLARVRTEAGGLNVVDAGVVRSVTAGQEGEVRIEIELRPGVPPEIVDTIRLVATGVTGVTGVAAATVELAHPSGGPPAGSGPAAGAEAGAAAGAAAGSSGRGGRRSLPVMAPPGGDRTPPPSPGRVSREEATRHPSEAEPLQGVKHVIAVSSGKGGVGKSTVATNLAAAWTRAGYRVGLMDADIYGPDIPTMFGAHEKPRMEDEQVIPVEAHGVKLMSLGFLVSDDTPAIWRGPIIMGIIRQFLHQIAWGELDYLIVDLPPGTGGRAAVPGTAGQGLGRRNGDDSAGRGSPGRVERDPDVRERRRSSHRNRREHARVRVPRLPDDTRSVRIGRRREAGRIDRRAVPRCRAAGDGCSTGRRSWHADRDRAPGLARVAGADRGG